MSRAGEDEGRAAHHEPLPVDEVLGELVATLRARGAVCLRAPAGAGKTTRVPPAVLDGLLRERAGPPQRVVVLEPRRLAARAAARRVAFERGSRVGEEVGHRVRFERVESARTRILFVTEGLFVRMLQEDPFLEGIGAVVLDEFHERGLDGDLALAMLARVRAEARPDLALVVMSATLDVAPIAAHLGAGVVESAGRLFPVDVRWLDAREALEARSARGSAALARLVRTGVERVLAAAAGDVLVFLPGVGEIRAAAEELAPLAARAGLDVVELYGELSPAEQDAALAGGPRRRVVLATNVAETSVTVANVTAVVDAGLARTLRFDPGVGLDRLELGRVSRASADQRAGRAGRTAPGVALRLWGAAEDRSLAERAEPAVRRVDLAGAVLELACWGEPDAAALPWLEPPPVAHLARARELLERLGALAPARPTESGSAPARPTALGHALARLPVHPRLGRLLLEARALGVLDEAAFAAALFAERDPFAAAARERPGAERPSSSDVRDRVLALRAFEEGRRSRSALGAPAPAAARAVLRARDQLARLVRELPASTALASDGARALAGGVQPPSESRSAEALGRALLAAWPDRLVRRRAPGDPRGVMVGGRGARLDEGSAVRDAELFVAVLCDAGRGETRVRLASAVERAWLDPARLATEDVVRFDEVGERVVGLRRTRFEDLVLDEVETGAAEPEAAAAALATAAAARLDRALDLDAPALTGWLARVRSLAHWRPELGLPELEPAALAAELAALLPELCRGRRSFAELRKAPLLDFLRGRLDAAQTAALQREAPERIAVPSGSRIRLEYRPGEAPVLAVRIQELFGLAETPRVAGGRVPVLLHLLAPSGRPQQVTSDLASFWRDAYHAVRRELERRYPKHDWPEDPLAAPPRARPGRRRDGGGR